ncbi:hypothetical protein [uncultured Allobaculum sp.]|uniref:hypothetical protein n=2 Tax=uncultured Allobaculum sp. TaxID=1187017 RepID=UPI00263A43E5|nr:hypothetical protein [uncultured Allobaculum sp.]
MVESDIRFSFLPKSSGNNMIPEDPGRRANETFPSPVFKKYCFSYNRDNWSAAIAPSKSMPKECELPPFQNAIQIRRESAPNRKQKGRRKESAKQPKEKPENKNAERRIFPQKINSE